MIRREIREVKKYGQKAEQKSFLESQFKNMSVGSMQGQEESLIYIRFAWSREQKRQSFCPAVHFFPWLCSQWSQRFHSGLRHVPRHGELKMPAKLAMFASRLLGHCQDVQEDTNACSVSSSWAAVSPLHHLISDAWSALQCPLQNVTLPLSDGSCG